MFLNLEYRKIKYIINIAEMDKSNLLSYCRGGAHYFR